jgi:hypothetical protein
VLCGAHHVRAGKEQFECFASRCPASLDRLAGWLAGITPVEIRLITLQIDLIEFHESWTLCFAALGRRVVHSLCYAALLLHRESQCNVI